jgi:hypothetical protein
MTEHAVSQIVNQRCRQGHFLLMISNLSSACPNVALDYSHKRSRCVKNANAMSKSSMRCAGVNELREAELLDPSQPLKWASLNDAPKHMLELIGSKLDQVVKRIAYPLWFYGRHGRPRGAFDSFRLFFFCSLLSRRVSHHSLLLVSSLKIACS